jgi:hypothetical protein
MPAGEHRQSGARNIGTTSDFGLQVLGSHWVLDLDHDMERNAARCWA